MQVVGRVGPALGPWRIGVGERRHQAGEHRPPHLSQLPRDSPVDGLTHRCRVTQSTCCSAGSVPLLPCPSALAVRQPGSRGRRGHRMPGAGRMPLGRVMTLARCVPGPLHTGDHRRHRAWLGWRTGGVLKLVYTRPFLPNGQYLRQNPERNPMHPIAVGATARAGAAAPYPSRASSAWRHCSVCWTWLNVNRCRPSTMAPGEDRVGASRDRSRSGL